MKQFKKCPFCGGEASLISGAKCNYVFCNACGAETGLCDTPDEAIAAWNTRKPIEQIVERLEFQAEESRDYWNNFDDEYAFGAMNVYTNAIEIVKEELDAK